MILRNAKKSDVLNICNNLSQTLIKDPLFMYFYPKIEERSKYIKDYLKYYVYEWSEYDTLLCSENSQALLTLVNPRTYEYTFKGKGARRMKKNKAASESIFRHRKIVRSTVHIIAPGSMNPRVLNIYANPDEEIEDINTLVNEAIFLANRNEVTLVYETFSQKLIPLMLQKGFSIAYQKYYYDTKYLQTIMVLPAKPHKKERMEIF